MHRLALAGTSWKAYARPGSSFRIAVPSNWQDVPRTAPGVKRRIAELRSQGRYSLASQYSAVIADAYTRKDLTRNAFEAFQWPAPPSPISTDTFVRVRPAGRLLLVPFTESLADSLRGGKDRVSGPHCPAPCGSSGADKGVQKLDPSYGGAKTACSSYVLLDRRKLYSISFRTDSRYEPRYRSTFEAIARTFGYI